MDPICFAGPSTLLFLRRWDPHATAAAGSHMFMFLIARLLAGRVTHTWRVPSCHLVASPHRDPIQKLLQSSGDANGELAVQMGSSKSRSI